MFESRHHSELIEAGFVKGISDLSEVGSYFQQCRDQRFGPGGPAAFHDIRLIHAIVFNVEKSRDIFSSRTVILTPTVRNPLNVVLVLWT